jgi:hypothetical protein
MPEEPDVSPQEEEILDRNISKRVEAKKQLRRSPAGQEDAIANRILDVLQSRPDGMTWMEIREMFDTNLSSELIRQALLTLKTTSLTREEIENNGRRPSERWFRLAS